MIITYVLLGWSVGLLIGIVAVSIWVIASEFDRCMDCGHLKLKDSFACCRSCLAKAYNRRLRDLRDDIANGDYDL